MRKQPRFEINLGENTAIFSGELIDGADQNVLITPEEQVAQLLEKSPPAFKIIGTTVVLRSNN